MDYYSTLGVAKNATPDEIKKAYRKLASQHHPDKGGDTNTFQQIQLAYDTLSDPAKRQQYDNPIPKGPQGFHFNFGQGQGSIHDIFNAFGGLDGIFRQHEQQSRGAQTFRTRVDVQLSDAYYGTKKTLQIHTNQGNHVIAIDVPKGIVSGQQIRYEQVLQNSNLMVEYFVASDLKFDRRNQDLYSNIPINMFDLVTGTTIEFTTISGKTVTVEVKPFTQPHMQLKLTGQGMPILNTHHYGDQILLLKPFIPDTIDSEIVYVLQKHKK